MRLHENEKEFTELIEVVSTNLKIDKRIVEKDYWVSFILSRLIDFTQKEQVIFRGGTSLTKCYTDLKRFSEDIDLAINNTTQLGRSGIKKLIRDVEKHIVKGFTEYPGGIKREDYRNVEYEYPIIFSNPFLKEVNTNIKIEIVSFLNPNPFEIRLVKSIIYEYLVTNDMQNEIFEFALEPFSINVLSIKRTLVDKIVSLVRMSYKKDLLELKSKTRHLYDLHMTYNTCGINEFYSDKDHLLEIIALVRQDEKLSKFKYEYPFESRWSISPLFKTIKENEIKDNYEMNFGREFVYGELPKYKDVLLTMEKIQNHLEIVGE
jgi:predicted nucleotidyltransferase component of viral defense system